MCLCAVVIADIPIVPMSHESQILRFHAKSIIEGFWKDFELSRHETYERYLVSPHTGSPFGATLALRV